MNINYVGSVNNVELTGGSAENYDLTLGSGTFIDGFEDQIIGHKPGETFDVNVTFPDGYSDSTDASGNTVKLSGQKAVFTVTLNYISESVLPELTDGPRGPVVVTMDTLRATTSRIEELKGILTNHPGTTDVHLRLVKPGREVHLRLDASYRVQASDALFGDLKVLLGPRCLTGG